MACVKGAVSWAPPDQLLFSLGVGNLRFQQVPPKVFIRSKVRAPGAYILDPPQDPQELGTSLGGLVCPLGALGPRQPAQGRVTSES